MVAIGTIAAIIQGGMMPGFIILFGNLINQFDASNASSLINEVTLLVRILIGIGVGAFILGYVQVVTWSLAGQRQAAAIRVAYFRALLRQEIGWFDLTTSGALTTQIAESLPKIQEAMGDKVGEGLVRGWCQCMRSVSQTLLLP